MFKNAWTFQKSIQEVEVASHTTLDKFRSAVLPPTEYASNLNRIAVPSGRYTVKFGSGTYAILMAMYEGALKGRFIWNQNGLQRAAERFLIADTFFQRGGYTPWSSMGKMWRDQGVTYFEQHRNFVGRFYATPAQYALTPVGIRDAWALYSQHRANSDRWESENHLQYRGHPRNLGLGSATPATLPRGVSSAKRGAGPPVQSAARRMAPTSASRTTTFSTPSRVTSVVDPQPLDPDSEEGDDLLPDPFSGISASTEVGHRVGGSRLSVPASAAAGIAARARLAMSTSKEPDVKVSGVKRPPTQTPAREIVIPSARVGATATSSSDMDDLDKLVKALPYLEILDDDEEVLPSSQKSAATSTVSVPVYPFDPDIVSIDDWVFVWEDVFGSVVRLEPVVDVTTEGCFESTSYEPVVIGYTVEQAPEGYPDTIVAALRSVVKEMLASLAPTKCSAAREPSAICGAPPSAKRIRIDADGVIDATEL